MARGEALLSCGMDVIISTFHLKCKGSNGFIVFFNSTGKYKYSLLWLPPCFLLYIGLARKFIWVFHVTEKAEQTFWPTQSFYNPTVKRIRILFLAATVDTSVVPSPLAPPSSYVPGLWHQASPVLCITLVRGEWGSCNPSLCDQLLSFLLETDPVVVAL